MFYYPLNLNNESKYIYHFTGIFTYRFNTICNDLLIRLVLFSEKKRDDVPWSFGLSNGIKLVPDCCFVFGSVCVKYSIRVLWVVENYGPFTDSRTSI